MDPEDIFTLSPSDAPEEDAKETTWNPEGKTEVSNKTLFTALAMMGAFQMYDEGADVEEVADFLDHIDLTPDDFHDACVELKPWLAKVGANRPHDCASKMADLDMEADAYEEAVPSSITVVGPDGLEITLVRA